MTATQPTRTALGQALAALREERHDTMQDMATRLGVSAAMLSRVESNERRAPMEWLERLRSAYHLGHAEVRALEDALLSSNEAHIQSRQKKRATTPFGVWLQEVRHMTGATTTDIGDLLGVSQSMVSNVARGKRTLPSRWFEPLAALYCPDEASVAALKRVFDEMKVDETVSVAGLDFDERRLVGRFARVIPQLSEQDVRAVSLWLDTLELSSRSSEGGGRDV